MMLNPRFYFLYFLISFLSGCSALDKKEPIQLVDDYNIALGYANAGKLEEADILLDKLIVFAQSLDAYQTHSRALILQGRLAKAREDIEGVPVSSATLELFNRAIKVADKLENAGLQSYARYQLMGLQYRTRQYDEVCQQFDFVVALLEGATQEELQFFEFESESHHSAIELVEARYGYFCKRQRNPGFSKEWYDENGRLRVYKRNL